MVCGWQPALSTEILRAVSQPMNASRKRRNGCTVGDSHMGWMSSLRIRNHHFTIMSCLHVDPLVQAFHWIAAKYLVTSMTFEDSGPAYWSSEPGKSNIQSRGATQRPTNLFSSHRIPFTIFPLARATPNSNPSSPKLIHASHHEGISTPRPRRTRRNPRHGSPRTAQDDQRKRPGLHVPRQRGCRVLQNLYLVGGQWDSGDWYRCRLYYPEWRRFYMSLRAVARMLYDSRECTPLGPERVQSDSN